MSDVILYKKQKDQLAKSVGKAFDALGDLALTLAELGISPTGRVEKGNIVPALDVAADAPSDEKPKKAKKEKAEKPSKSKKSGNGSSAHLTEM